MHRLVVALLVAAALAGCASNDGSDGGTAVQAVNHMAYHDAAGNLSYLAPLDPVALLFGTPLLIDEVRAGGEPVIAVAPDDSIIVAAHPGWTHYHPTMADPDHTELVSAANGQSYLWRSSDGGETWAHIGLAGAVGPRSTGIGFSDPDITVDGTGRIWYTDLIALAEQSISYSDDFGATWAAGNVVSGSGAVVDRQWMGSHGDTVYLTANYIVDRSGGSSPDGARPFMTTGNDGLTWDTIGYAPCGGDFVVDPRDGTIVMGCGLGFATSTDGAAWTVHEPPAGLHRGFFAHEPAIDMAGGIYTAMNGQPLTPGSPATVLVSYSPDRGESWKQFDLGPLINDTLGSRGTHVFAWVSAGSEGRAAVSWIGSPDVGRPDSLDGEWFVYTAFLLDAHTATPTIQLQQVTADPVHRGPMCSSGTTCQVQSVGLDPVMGTDNGDRRMGDFFETTLDREGRLLMAFANTVARPDDVVSHPMFVKQTGGPSLLAPGDAWVLGWPLQG